MTVRERTLGERPRYPRGSVNGSGPSRLSSPLFFLSTPHTNKPHALDVAFDRRPRCFSLCLLARLRLRTSTIPSVSEGVRSRIHILRSLLLRASAGQISRVSRDSRATSTSTARFRIRTRPASTLASSGNAFSSSWWSLVSFLRGWVGVKHGS